MTIFKPCDIRGIYGQELHIEDAYSLGHALAAQTGPREVLVGGDARLSTPTLQNRLIEALVEAGCRVVDLGCVSTPIFYFARHQLGIPTGVMVTASHNPAKYNGFKITLGELPITPAEMAIIKSLVEKKVRSQAGPGNVRTLDQQAGYTAAMQSHVGLYRGSKIVVDYGNGMAALAGPAIWQVSQAQVFSLFDRLDGEFPNRSPNPAVSANLEALCRTVREIGADLGFAYDGDGDRMAVVDERGHPLENDTVIALLAQCALENSPATVIYDQKCSSHVQEAIHAAQGRPIMERSGHTFIKTTFIQEGAVYAGELSGHHFFRALPQGDDGLMASIFFAGLLVRDGRPLSELVAEIPVRPITPDIRLEATPSPRPAFLHSCGPAWRGRPG